MYVAVQWLCTNMCFPDLVLSILALVRIFLVLASFCVEANGLHCDHCTDLVHRCFSLKYIS